MNILQAHKYFWKRDGASNYFLYLSDMLREKGNTVIPFSMQHPKAEKSDYAKYFVSEMDLSDPSQVSFGNKIRFAARMFYSFEAKRNMKRLLQDEKIDLVHVHNIYHHISPSILPLIKKHGIPVVMTLHDYKLICPNRSLFHHGAVHEEDCEGWYGSCVKGRCIKGSRAQSRIARWEMIFHHKIMKYYEKHVDLFISPSEFLIDLCVKYGWPREKFVHVPNTIDVDAFAPAKKDGDAVVYAGGLLEEKGIHVLLATAAKTPDIPYVIVGTGPLEKELKATVKKKKLSNVRFTGFLTGDALQKEMGNARLFVLPSLWYENNPLSILEASAMEKITVGSYSGGIPEMLPTECLAQTGDADDLAQTIQAWYVAPLLQRKTIGKQLRQQVLERNHPSAHLQKIQDIYTAMTP